LGAKYDAHDDTSMENREQQSELVAVAMSPLEWPTVPNMDLLDCSARRRKEYLGRALHRIPDQYDPGGEGSSLDEPQIEPNPIRKYFFASP
jgi:hypothetical protein